MNDNDFSFLTPESSTATATTASPVLGPVENFEGPSPTPLEAGNAARERAGQSLSQLTWTFSDGIRRHPKLTASRWALYEAVRQSAWPVMPTEDVTAAFSSAYSQRYLTSTLLLWLCLHEPEAWETPRPRDVALCHDWPALVRHVRVWVDENIPVARLDDAVVLAEALAHLTFSAVPVRVPNPDDEEDPEDDGQKKTPR